MEYGLQTYTIKKLIKTPEAMNKTMKEISELGIKYVELAVDYLKMDFSVKTAEIIRDITNKYGIKIISIQIRYKTVIKDFALTMQIIKILGVNYITNSVIDFKLLMKGVNGVIEYCSLLNELILKCKPYGVTVAHHNHHFEFLKFDGIRVFDIMSEYFKGEFVLDTYWLQRGGGNHLVMLKALSGRVSIMHLRDYKIKYKLFDLRGTDCEIGKGNLPFPEIIQCATECGVKYGMIEQSTETPIESVTTSYNYLCPKGKKLIE